MAFEIDNHGIRFEEANGAIFEDIKLRVDEYFNSKNLQPTATGFVWFKGAFWGALMVAAYLLMYQFPGSRAWTLIFGGLYGLASLFFVLNISHDAAHGALVKSRPANNLIHFLVFNFLGVNSHLWQMRHNNSHHVFPNVVGCDADIDHNPILRLSPHHQRRSYQRWQHFYAPFVYLIVNVHSILVQDPIYLFKTQLANLKKIRHSRAQITLFVMGKLQYLLLNLILPLIFLKFAWTDVVIGYFVVTALISVAFVVPLIGTHFSKRSSFPDPDESQRIRSSYFRHQIDSSVDWSAESAVASFFYAGLNAHIAHHLFPRVCHIHYPQITGIIYERLDAHGIHYENTNFFGVIGRHFAFLRQMALS